METPGAVLITSNAGANRVRSGVHGAGHHAVGQSEQHHHRAEVRDVDDDVARHVEGDSLVRPQGRILDGEPLQELRVVRIEDSRRADVQPELVGLRFDPVGIAEHGQVRDLPAEQGGRGADDAFLVPLG